MKFNSIKRNLIIAIFIALTAIFIIAFTACVQSPQREEEKGEPQQLTAPANFSIVDENLCWDEVENADYYSVRYSNYEKRVSVNSFSLSDLSKSNITFRIRACSNNERYLSSEWVSYNYVKTEPKPTSEIVGAFKYTLLEDGSGYEVARADMNSSSGLAGRVVIPDYFRGLPVKSIASSTFVLFEWVSMGAGYKEESRNSITTSVQLPVHLETIGSGAFLDCIALTSITIPDTVTSIGSGAFSGCSELSDIKLSENLQSLGNNAFHGTAWYKNQPDGFVTILDNILYCYKGEMAEGTVIDKLPSNIKYLAGGAFYKCDKLVSVNLTGVKIFGSSTFEGCTSLKSVTLPSDIIEIPEFMFYNCTALETFTIPEGITKMGSSTFYGCKSLKSVTLPSDITEIPESMFYNCTALEMFTIPEGITKIGSSTFYGCTSLKSVTLPSGITEIPDSMFGNCTALETFTIPERVTKIGSWAFRGCTSLKSVTLPSGITEIPKLMFSNCRALETVTIPEGVTLLETSAFNGCTKLKNIIIPSTVKTIMNDVFSSYMDSTEIYYKGTKEQWDSIEIRKTSTVTDILERVKKYFYSESEPADDGNYWHYVDGEPVIWTKE